jgi:hypothetical protein
LSRRHRTGGILLLIALDRPDIRPWPSHRSTLQRTAGFFEVLFQDDRSIVIFVMGRMEQREASFRALFPKQLDGFVLVLQLGPIQSLELLPPSRIGILTEGLVQSGAGRDVFEPEVKLGMFLVQVPRPEPLDQDSKSVLRRRIFICSFQVDHERKSSRASVRQMGLWPECEKVRVLK